MRKPRKGYASEIYDILEEHGPLAYYGIRQHLNARGSEMKPKQTRHAISNLCQRGYVERSRTDVRRFEICSEQPDRSLHKPEPELSIVDPIPPTLFVEKTPEREEVTPLIVILIAVITSAITTTILEKL